MKALLLRLLRVPPEPAPPPGSGDDLTVFRASTRFLGYSVVEWLLKQASALFGIVVSLLFIGGFELPFLRIGGWDRFREEMRDEDFSVGLGALRVEAPFFDLVGLFEIVAIGGFLVQLVISGLLLKLHWEQRWYMVGDASLRIREGLFRVREQTMTVANIQNMSVRQGPIQRLLGIADLEVQTAGGGSKGDSGNDDKSGKNSLHIGRIRGLEDAQALRNRIRASLVKHRSSGLGDPDDDHGFDGSAAPGVEAPDGGLDRDGWSGIQTRRAAALLLDEAIALRRQLEAG